jgi:hypothetical protein
MQATVRTITSETTPTVLLSLISVERDSGDFRKFQDLWTACCFDEKGKTRPVVNSGIDQGGFDLLVEKQYEKDFLNVLQNIGVKIKTITVYN